MVICMKSGIIISYALSVFEKHLSGLAINKVKKQNKTFTVPSKNNSITWLPILGGCGIIFCQIPILFNILF